MDPSPIRLITAALKAIFQHNVPDRVATYCFDELVITHTALIRRRFASRQGLQESDTEDVVQEAGWR